MTELALKSRPENVSRPSDLEPKIGKFIGQLVDLIVLVEQAQGDGDELLSKRLDAQAKTFADMEWPNNDFRLVMRLPENAVVEKSGVPVESESSTFVADHYVGQDNLGGRFFNILTSETARIPDIKQVDFDAITPPAQNFAKIE